MSTALQMRGGEGERRRGEGRGGRRGEGRGGRKEGRGNLCRGKGKDGAV